ncbi:MAG: helix-turn-helix transcriptional regulator [Lachnospiraceae bacterium]|nr:helix-turn-helix transcriptional regulator [Lachnospiraceae bacterium]
MEFGDRLKQFRMSRGLSQEQLAEKISVSRQAITKWETNRGLPDVENMVSLAEIFGITLDELVLAENENTGKKTARFGSETVYDIDCSKHFDIHMGSAKKIMIFSGDDEKIHIRLESDSLEDLGSIFKIKLDEKKNRLDIDCVKKKGISRYEAEESVDVVISLPKNYTEHCEIGALAKELFIEGLKLERLEYDGAADRIFIKDTEGSLELTGKTDYDITIEGRCTQLDVNQWSAKTMIHVADPDVYKVVNKGRKCRIYYEKDGILCENISDMNGENILSISGICSELIISSR